MLHSPNLHHLFSLTWSNDATWWVATLTSFRTWVTVVRKKCFSRYYSTYGCYIHQTYTICSAWHDRMMPHDGLRPWPTFYTWVTMVRIGKLCNFIGELSNWIGELCISIRTLSNSFKDKLHWRTLIQFESSVIQAEGAIEITHRLLSVEPRELLSPYHCLSSVRRQISILCLVVTMFVSGILLYLWHIKDPYPSMTWVMSNRSHPCWPI